MEEGDDISAPCLTGADAVTSAGAEGLQGLDDDDLYRAMFGGLPMPSIAYTYNAGDSNERTTCGISPADSTLA